MRTHTLPLALLMFSIQGSDPAPAQQPSAGGLQIPASSFVLENGLHVVIHPDADVPDATVELWYRAGGRYEAAGQFGVAHLFEHALGPQRALADPESRTRFERLVRDANAQTMADYTRYFVQVPATALEMALAVTADRMYFDPELLTPQQVESYRGVVLNELQRANSSGRWDWNLEARALLAAGVYGAAHPYGHEQSLDDVRRATADDLRRWYRERHGADGALLVVAGAVEPARAEQIIRRYFSAAPPGMRGARTARWVPRGGGERRDVLEADVARPVVVRAWPIPEWGSADGDYLVLLRELLLGRSRLPRAARAAGLPASAPFAEVQLLELAGDFRVGMELPPSADLLAAERVIDGELARLLATGPSAEELEGARARFVTTLAREAESLGSGSERIRLLGEGTLFTGRPDAYRARLARIAAATPEQIAAAGRRWLATAGYTLHVSKAPPRRAAGTPPDLARLPEALPPPPVRFPAIQRTRLPNGLEVLLVERHTVPLVQMRMLVRGGPGPWRGTAGLLLDVLEEGTRTRGAEQVEAALARAGGTLATATDPDFSIVDHAVASGQLDDAGEILADLLLFPALPPAAVERARAARLEQIAADLRAPQRLRRRLLPGLVYGNGHPYAQDLDGAGETAGLQSLTREELASYHAARFRPGDAVLLVAGDVSMAELEPRLRRWFGGWAPGPRGAPAAARVPAAQPQPGVYLIDQPGATQSVIMAAQVLPPDGTEVAPAEAAVWLLGDLTDSFLRGARQWSYGARTIVVPTAGAPLAYVETAVQPDRTGEALAAIRAELERLRAGESPTPGQADRVRGYYSYLLGQRTGSLEGIIGALTELVRAGRPAGYVPDYARGIAALTPEVLAAGAREALDPRRMVWLVIGDRRTVEPQLGGKVRVLEP